MLLLVDAAALPRPPSVTRKFVRVDFSMDRDFALKQFFELVRVLPAQRISIAVGGMGIPRIKAQQDFLLGRFACGVCRLPILDLVLHPLGAIPAQLLDDRAGVGQVAMESQKINTVPQRENGGFLVQLKAVTFHKRPHIPENALQFPLVRTDDIEIVHVCH